VWSFVVNFGVVARVAVQCDHVLCPVQFLCFQKTTDFKEQCIWIRLLLQIGRIGAEAFQVLVNICFQRGSSEAHCSIWLFCRVQKWNDICQGCWIFRVPAFRQNVQKCGTYFGIWHESRCIAVHKLVNELGNLLVYVIKFWHQTEFVIDCVKISVLCAYWWTKTIRIASVPTRTLRKNVRHTLFLSEVITGDNMGSPCLK